MQWTIEEFGPDLEFINGSRNVVADALISLDIEMFHSKLKFDVITELFKNSDAKNLNIKLSKNTQHWCNTSNVIRSIPPNEWVVIMSYFKNNKIYIPKTLRKEILQ
jgi:hypothetical protein